MFGSVAVGFDFMFYFWMVFWVLLLAIGFYVWVLEFGLWVWFVNWIFMVFVGIVLWILSLLVWWFDLLI